MAETINTMTADKIYDRLTPKNKAIIDSMSMMFYTAIVTMAQIQNINEKQEDSKNERTDT